MEVPMSQLRGTLPGLALALLIPVSAHGAVCTTVSGKVEEAAVTPLPAMTTFGNLSGSLGGTYSFVLTNALAAQDPYVMLFVGFSTIAARKGNLYLTDAGALDTASSTVVDLLTVSGGDRDYAGASGQIVFTGTFDPVTGVGEFKYQGQVCVP